MKMMKKKKKRRTTMNNFVEKKTISFETFMPLSLSHLTNFFL